MGGELKVLNADGKESISTIAESRTLDIAHLPVGLHILTVHKNGRTVNARFVKK
jgi:hypothetical protein